MIRNFYVCFRFFGERPPKPSRGTQVKRLRGGGGGGGARPTNAHRVNLHSCAIGFLAAMKEEVLKTHESSLVEERCVLACLAAASAAFHVLVDQLR